MCHAVLRITYKGEKNNKAELIEVDSEREMDQRLKEIQLRDQVLKVGIFKRAHDVVRTEKWESVVYVPKPESAPELVAA